MWSYPYLEIGIAQKTLKRTHAFYSIRNLRWPLRQEVSQISYQKVLCSVHLTGRGDFFLQVLDPQLADVDLL